MAKNTNSNLAAAKTAKKDEFYTQLSDIEKEMRHYWQHFEGKTILCNCDDPFESNFFKYFVLNFNRLRLKKLIATSYIGSPIMGEQLLFGIDENGDMVLSLDDDPAPKIEKKPYKAIVTSVHDATGNDAVEMLDVAKLFKTGENELTELDGNGDFRSQECIELLEEADIVITNPPFSLFREYVAQLMQYEKKFIIIGNQNAITYKEIFPLLKDNKIWLGYGFPGNVGFFGSPYEDIAVSSQHKEGLIRISGVMWFTNLDIKKRHEELILVQRYSPEKYPKYDNYDAIEVSKTADIPFDYAGEMGVPITFMDKYCPEQFDIVGLLQSSDEELAGIPILRIYNDFKEMRQDMTYTGSSGGKANGNPVLPGKSAKGNFLYNPITDEYVHSAYARILIRNKNPEQPKDRV